MTIRRLAALSAALLLTISLAGCGEEAEGTTPDDSTATITTTTTSSVDEDTRGRLLAALAANCASLTSYEVSEKVIASFEANGTVSAGSEMTANLTVTPDAVSAVCEQVTGEDTTQTLELYSAGERLYVQNGDTRYTLELALADVLKTCGVVLMDNLPDFSQPALADQLTLTEIDDGYAFSCELSGSAVKGELTAMATALRNAMGEVAENAEVAAFAVTAEVTPEGRPTRIGYSILQNVLTNGNFFTVYTSVDVTFTAIGDKVTLTPPEDLASYDGAETAYRAIVDAVLDENGKTVENVSDVYERLKTTYGAELVDSVLYMIGVTV